MIDHVGKQIEEMTQGNACKKLQGQVNCACHFCQIEEWKFS